jgi:hypothetical protein
MSESEDRPGSCRDGSVVTSERPQGRTAKQVLDDHLRLRQEGRLDEDLERNYREDVVMLTPSATYEGLAGVRECAELLYKAIRDASDYEYHATVCDERMALLEWSATAEDMMITDGVDSYLIEDGRICAQTIRYTVTFKDLSQAHSIG